jgi:gamma-tubulin complex component 2
LLKEYLVLVAQLEHQLRADCLTLQKLWFFVQPALHTLLCLRAVCNHCNRASGGALLNALSGCADRLCGDARAAELLGFLQARAAAPYLDMLRRWIYEGLLDDP